MQATISSITPFDAALGTTISFRWDGNMSFQNQCIIKDNETNQTIYDNTIDSFESKHTLDLTKFTAPLENGKWYLAFIVVYDRYGTASDIQSVGTTFLCLKTPTFVFTGLPAESTLTSSTQTLSLSYSQENNEPLNEWSITIYSSSRTQVSTSGQMYGTDSLEYTFSGFADNTEYYIRAVGQTLHGMSVDTDYIYVMVRYDTKGMFSLLQPVNVAERGAIDLRCNIVSAEGELEKEGVYVNDDYLDLRDNKLTYDVGFVLPGNFSLAFSFFNAEINQTVANFQDEDGDLIGTITYRIGRFGTEDYKACYELRIENGLSTITLFSNEIDIPESDDLICILLIRENGLYSIEIKNTGKAVL